MASIMSSLTRKSLRSSLLLSFAVKRPDYLPFSSSVSSSSFLLPRGTQQNTTRPFSAPFLSSSGFRFASSGKKAGADENLKRVLYSEIKCAEESDDLNLVLPDVSPFEIVDNTGEQTITLKREFIDETIQIEVHMPDLIGEDGKDEDADSGDDAGESSHQPNVSLIVTVAKAEEPYLEFCCTAYPDQIIIESMLMKGQKVSDDKVPYEGPPFSDLDENLQKAFYQYLEARGIRSSLTNSVQEYMVNKDDREYLRWLKNMKDFVES